METVLQAELRISSKKENHTPDITLEARNIEVKKGTDNITIDFDAEVPGEQYLFLILKKNESIEVKYSEYFS